MQWKLWKIGLVVAIVTGACTAFAVGGIVSTATAKQLWLLLAGFIAKDLLLYIHQHPVEKITFDTTTITKTPGKTETTQSSVTVQGEQKL